MTHIDCTHRSKTLYIIFILYLPRYNPVDHCSQPVLCMSGPVVWTTRSRRSPPPPHDATPGDRPRDPMYNWVIPHPNSATTNSQCCHLAAAARVPSSTKFHRQTMRRRPDPIGALVPRGGRVGVGGSMTMARVRGVRFHGGGSESVVRSSTTVVRVGVVLFHDGGGVDGVQ
jgi:hypothetical protein